MLPPLSLNILLFTFVFLMTEMFELTNWIVNYHVGMSTVLLLILYSIPDFLIFVIPMSVMVAILLTFLRMSRDNEILAFKSCGLSLYKFLPSTLLLCLLGFVCTLFMTVYGLPWGRSSMRELTVSIATSNLDIGLRERAFNDGFKDVMLYVNKYDSNSQTLIDVFLEDKRQPDTVNTVVAPKGQMLIDPDGSVVLLRLFDGTIFRTNLEDRTASSIRFTTYDSSLDLERNVPENKGKKKHRKELSLQELRDFIKQSPNKDRHYYKALLEWHRKFSLPFACFSLGILALPLGLQSRAAKRSFGLVLGLFLFLFYYLLLSAGMTLGESGVYPPVIGMWFPNFLVGMLGVYLFILTGKERVINIQSPVIGFQRMIPKFKRS